MARIYLAGEVWRYQSRDQEPHARLFIVKVDRQENGEEIFHCALDNLAINAPGSPDGVLKEIGHLPLSRTCLDESITDRVIYVGAMPDVDAGYTQWHEAFANGEAGVFDLPVREIVDLMEQTIGSQDSVDAASDD